MSDDRELLELAAKAFGIDGVYSEKSRAIVNEDGYFMPLDDDGDTLRLAAHLNISIDISGMFVHADCRHCEVDIGYFEENTARNSSCIMKSIRRAVVRAAAAIGEGIK